jgi:hypothetical protein
MTPEKQAELSKLASHQIKLAEDYSKERTKSGNAKADLDLILTANISEIREKKANVGMDMAYIMLMEDHVEAAKLYKEWQQSENNYKGLEKLIEAHQSKISLEQSIMKYVGTGEKYG